MRIKDTEVEVLYYVMPEHVNPIGTLYGGRMMNWMMTAGSLTASRLAKGMVVIGSMDNIFFIKPIKVGDVLTMKARVDLVGKSSMEVTVEAYKEMLKEGTREIATVAHMGFVAVDEKGRPRPVPKKVRPEGEKEFEIHEDAQMRRLARLERIKDRHRKVNDIKDVGYVKHKETLSRMVFPEDAFLGRMMFAGKLMMILDEIAGILASRFSRDVCVTASVDAVDFYAPIWVGEVVRISAGISYVGRTSMDITVKAVAEDILSGKLRHTCTAIFTFVHVDGKGRPIPLPELKPTTEEEWRLWNQEEDRRKKRLEILENVKRSFGVES